MPPPCRPPPRRRRRGPPPPAPRPRAKCQKAFISLSRKFWPMSIRSKRKSGRRTRRPISKICPYRTVCGRTHERYYEVIKHEPGELDGGCQEHYPGGHRCAAAAGDDAGNDGAAAATAAAGCAVHLQHLVVAGGAAVGRVFEKTAGVLVVPPGAAGCHAAAARAQRR